MTFLEKWLVFLSKHSSNTRDQIIFFPHAGGTSHNFGKFVKLFDGSIQLIAVELPGKGLRLNEPSIINFDEVIGNLTIAIDKVMTKNTVFLGHSMGALIAYECAKKLTVNHRQLLKALVVSGQAAPSFHKHKKYLNANATDQELIAQLKVLNGLSDELISHPELLSMILETIRADCKLIESYNHQASVLLDCPLVCITSNNDKSSTYEEYDAWRKETNNQFFHIAIEGDHLALFDNKDVVPFCLSSILNDNSAELFNYARK